MLKESDLVSFDRKNQLRWLGHVERMPANRIPKKLLDANNDLKEQNIPVDEDCKRPEGELIERRFRHLAQSFRERTARVRKRFDLPPTPSTVSSEPGTFNISPSFVES
ncbi:unnamed protein product [Nezara viridula]|uniref:Uncharacterized protein n=1 Tax=Nezara viridula TaxID=85310 RepID=A0A9P0H681_NEZVI|nr:unnamed protein product [Nezara viridula]